MHRRLLATIAAMLLVACTKPAPEAAQAEAAPAATPASAPADAPTLQTNSETGRDALVDKTIDELLGDHAQYKRVFHAFQRAVVAKDPAAVAALVDYPFTAHIAGKRIIIANPAAFVAQYDAIVTPSIARAIGGQAYRNLFVNQKGVMFGSGEAWLNGVCQDAPACQTIDVRVVAIQPTTR